MPGKKKKGGKKKAADDGAAEEVTLEELQSAFKKECKALSVPTEAAQPIADIFASYLEDAEEKGALSQLCVGRSIGDDGLCVRALFGALQKSKYSQLQCVCFWRADIGDAGAKAAGDIVANIASIAKLEIRDSALSASGCWLLSKALLLNNRTLKSLRTLRLDFNRFGSDGLLQIAHGLVHNRCVRRLSFAFCAIEGDKTAADALHSILSNCFALEELNLENNALGSKGCVGLITGMASLRSTTLKALDLSSNQIGQDLADGDVQILHALAQQFRACASLKQIALHANFFGEKIADVFLMMLSDPAALHITSFTVPHTLPAMVVAAFSKTLQAHKPKAKAKAKGKGKAKKGKAKKKGKTT